MTDPTTPESPRKYKDDDLVYVDPETKTVIGIVEWGKNDRPLSKAAAAPAATTDAKGRRTFHRKFYPWGTYRSMRRIYKLEGKMKEAEPNKQLEEVLPKALNEAFWSWDGEKQKSLAPENQKV